MREVDTIITGGAILTLDRHNLRIEDGALAVDGDSIVKTGSAADINKQFVARQIIEANDCLVMPGLINGHTHAAMSCFRGMADDLELMDWLGDYIFPAESKNVDPELVYWGSLLANAEMIKSGTTTFCDMYLFEEETAQAAKQAGVRCLLGEGLFDFPSPNAQTPAEALAYARKLLDKWDGDPLINFFIAPHSLYTCSPDVLAAAKQLADEYQIIYGLHLLENEAERSQLQHKYGKKTLHFLKDTGYLTERFLSFHCVCVDDEDMRLLADHGCRVVHNPESNMKLASGIAPVTAMMRTGVAVGLGTDGCASNNNLDMFQEMDTAAKLQKVSSLDPAVMDARTVVRMATCDGAQVLGLGNITGSLEVGKKADIIIIDLNKPHLTPLYNEYSHIVYAVGGADVDTVLINGKVVMRKRELLTIDEGAVIAEVKDIARRIKFSLQANETK